jgi:hypothetical protein
MLLFYFGKRASRLYLFARGISKIEVVRHYRYRPVTIRNISPSRERRTSSVEALVGAEVGRPRLLLTLPPSSLFVAGRLGRGWLYVFCSDQRCSRGLVMADDRAIDRPSHLAPGPSRVAYPSPFSPFARSSASGPPRHDFAARRARATVRASSVVPPPASLDRTSASGRRATPRHNARRPLRSPLSVPPLGGSWASVVRGAPHLRRPSPPYESVGKTCCSAAGC